MYTDYTELMQDIGAVIYEQSYGSYSGDTRALLKKNSLYGYLEFGWGSCSGCDALEGCVTDSDFEELRNDMAGDIIWRTKSEMKKFLLEHDWDGDYNPDTSFAFAALKCIT